MTSLRPWLAPTLLGPLLTMWGLATWGSLAAGAAALSHGFVDDWALLMLWATFFGCTMGVALVGADVLLLAMGWRRLPTGMQAWISSLLTPWACFAAWMLIPPPGSAFGAVLFVLGTILVAAIATRTLLGRRP